MKNPVGKPPKDCLVYAYWGHNMGLATSMTLILTGPFACMWTKIEGYSCVIDGKQIASEYILGQGNDASCTDATTGVVYCCDPDRGLIDVGQHASNFVGVYSIIIGILFLIFENIEWGFGLQFSYNIWYVKKQIPIHAILYFIFGCISYESFPTII